MTNVEAAALVLQTASELLAEVPATQRATIIETAARQATALVSDGVETPDGLRVYADAYDAAEKLAQALERKR